ncbi:MAG: (d)CMP kinase [Rhodobacteraceae bacterium]|nr:(d)CMP kinase [Paracoccaceae bacterium]
MTRAEGESADCASEALPSPTVIAIDGPAASGKGTIAKRVASRYGLAHLDSGLLYRAVGLQRLHEIDASGGEIDDPMAAAAAAMQLTASDLAPPELRGAPAAEAASHVAAIPGVRAALVDFQRRFLSSPPDGAPGAVLDGRDIGTVIAPDADVKLYVTASAEERARRRCEELAVRGAAIPFEEVLAAIETRDRRDVERIASPLRRADDAYLLDTTSLDIEASFTEAVRVIERAIPHLTTR